MHLRIKKKEKYLLFSMVCYLLIVSLALLIIFGPVQAWTQLGQNTHVEDGAGYSFITILLNKTDSVTRVTWLGSCSSPYGDLKPYSGTENIDFNNGYTCLSPKGGGTLSIENPLASGDINWSSSCTLDFRKTWGNWPSAQDDAICVNGTTQQVFYGTSSKYHFQFKRNVSKAWIGNYDALLAQSTSSYRAGGLYTIYSGTDIPDAPVITNFTVEKSCYNPNESVILHADVTGTVDTWNWKVYDLNGTVISETSDPVDTVTDPLLVVGLLAAKVTVTNEGGTDDDYRTGFINVTQPGECNFTPYNPFPTVTATPTIQVYPTLTLPEIVDTNMTGINDEIDDLFIIGNMSEGYREMVDYYGEGVNTTFTGLVGIIVSPFTFIANAVSTGSALFSNSVASLMSYTTIPLAIVGITLSYYPWQIITLITAGIAIDAVFVLVFGVR